MTDIPDYTGEEEQPEEDVLTRLRRMTMSMLQLDNEIEDAETVLKTLKERRNKFANELIPTLMRDSGIDKLRITTGVEVSLLKEIHCTLSEERKPAWMAYLTSTGNDGLLKRELTISYGRDKTTQFNALSEHLKEIGVHQDATVAQKETIHAQTLRAFLRQEVKTNPEVLEIFGAYERQVAEVKLK